MADLTIDELLTSYTADQLWLSSPQGNTGVFVDNLVGLGLPADQWRPGSIASSVTRAVAILYAAFSLVIVAIAKFGFLVTSSGGWLRLLARYQYGVEPIFATAAIGAATLTNSGGGFYSFAAGELVLKNSVSLKLYKNLVPVTINSGDPPVTFAIEAYELGTVGNAATGEITQFQTPRLGLTVTNALAVVGTDDELDPALIGRCLDALGARSVFGPGSAYRYAISVATLLDGSPVNVNRSRVSAFSSNGQVNIIIASAAGAVTPADVAGVITSVELLAEVDTDTVSVTSAVAVPFAKTLTVWATQTKGLDAPTLTAEIDAALIAFTAEWPIGGRLRTGDTVGSMFDDSIREEAKTADATIWLVESDGIDLVLATNQVAALAVTLNVRIVPDN